MRLLGGDLRGARPAAGRGRRRSSRDGSRASGPAGSPCTPATCPSTPSSPVSRSAGARTRWPLSTSTACPTSAWIRSSSSRCCPGCGPSWPPPVEDLRVDAEDGYRGAADVEDDDVRAAAAAMADDVVAGIAPPWFGIRAKSLELGTRHRGLRSPRPLPHHPRRTCRCRRSPPRPGRPKRRELQRRGHAAEGDRRRAGARVLPRARRAREGQRRRARPGGADRDPAGGDRPGRRRHRRPRSCTPPAAG